MHKNINSLDENINKHKKKLFIYRVHETREISMWLNSVGQEEGGW